MWWKYKVKTGGYISYMYKEIDLFKNYKKVKSDQFEPRHSSTNDMTKRAY